MSFPDMQILTMLVSSYFVEYKNRNCVTDKQALIDDFGFLHYIAGALSC